MDSRQEIKLDTSINLDTVNEDVKSWGTDAPHNVNTGICRDGGITNVYKNEFSLSAGSEILQITDSGDLIYQQSSENVFFRSRDGLYDGIIGTIPNSIFGDQYLISGYDDVICSDNSQYLIGVRIIKHTATVTTADIYLDKISLDGNLIASTTVATFVDVISAYLVRGLNRNYDTYIATNGIVAKKYSGGIFRYDYYGSVNGTLPTNVSNPQTFYHNAGNIFVTQINANCGYVTKAALGTWVDKGNEYNNFVMLKGITPSDTDLIIIGTVNTNVGTKTGCVATYTLTSIGTVTGPTALDSIVIDRTKKYYNGPGFVTGFDSTGKMFFSAYIAGIGIITGTNGATSTTFTQGLCDGMGGFGISAGFSNKNLYFGSFNGAMSTVSFGTKNDPGNLIIPAGDLFSFSDGNGRTYTPTYDAYYSFATGITTLVLKTFNGFSVSKVYFDYNHLPKIVRIKKDVYKIMAGTNRCIIDCTGVPFMDIDYSTQNMCIPYTAATSTDTNAFSFGNQYSNAFSYPALPMNATNVGVSTGSVLFQTTSYDIFKNGVYDRTVNYAGTSSYDYTKLGTLFVNNQNIGIPMSATIEQGGVNLVGSSAIQTPDYAGYLLANQLPQDFQFFNLFGQLYGFDGQDIYTIALQGQLFSSANKVATANGLRIIAVAPTAVYFLSDFDNSLFTFDGGRNVQKFARLNNKSNIIDGVYNTNCNELCLRTTDSLIFMRDGVFTENTLPYTPSRLNPSDNRTYIVDGTNYTSYTYEYDPASSVPLPLTWQSAYYGLNTNEKQRLHSYVVTVYNQAKEAVTVNASILSFNAENYNQEDQKTIVINQSDWTSKGYFRFRLIPKYQNTLANSIQLSSQSKITILQVDAYFVDDTAATIQAGRSY